MNQHAEFRAKREYRYVEDMLREAAAAAAREPIVPPEPAPAAPPEATPLDIFATFTRVVIGSFFLAKSAGLVLAGNALHQVFAAGLIPGTFIWVSVGFEFLAAFCVLIGFQTVLAASVLAVHVFWSSYLFNYDPGNLPALHLFWKDFSMVMGLFIVILLSRYGAGLDRLSKATALRGLRD
ncbi:hypothetical protein DDZ14_00955 [Maritimibacter sp. 55A14]|uniref:DoxX family protein n=1 Tax=Maritimibacter sp. 55A14 TaxID=2174844 RepID=UPI000D6185EE|nr:DoxX family protein [Maritimibacter sp. 55A14]PWE34310.1 hypothetical protein DDZ14_00955 [Maritimibacter sp. 55A14]